MNKIINTFKYLGITFLSFVAIYFSYMLTEQSIMLFLMNLSKILNKFTLFTLKNVCYYGILSIIFITLIFMLFKFLAKSNNDSDKLNFSKFKQENNVKNVFKSACILYLMIIFGNYIISFISRCFSTASTSYNQQILNGQFANGGYRMIFVIVLSLFVAPIIEEIMIRYLFLGYLNKKINLTLNKNNNSNLNKIIILFLLILSSLAFAWLHSATNLASFAQYFWMGICLGMIFLKYNSIYASMLLHFINNAISLALMFIMII